MVQVAKYIIICMLEHSLFELTRNIYLCLCVRARVIYFLPGNLIVCCLRRSLSIISLDVSFYYKRCAMSNCSS